MERALPAPDARGGYPLFAVAGICLAAGYFPRVQPEAGTPA